jgi:hypothetical protein
MSYRFYNRGPTERMAPAEGVPHEKYEGGSGPNAYLVYTWCDPSKGYYLLAYRGRRMRPDVYQLYRSEEGRDKARDERLEMYRERVKAVEAEKALDNPLKVGDLLRCSWGYEQTNVDYYQVVAASRRGVTLREVAAESVEGSGNGMSDRVRPVKDKFVGEPMKKRVQVYRSGGEVACSVTMTSYSHAYPCGENETAYRSWYY